MLVEEMDVYVPLHTTEIMPDQIHYHEVLGLLFGCFQLGFCHFASLGGGFLDGAFDGAELAGAFSGPGEEALWTAADDFDVLGRVGAREVEVGAERRWVG